MESLKFSLVYNYTPSITQNSNEEMDVDDFELDLHKKRISENQFCIFYQNSYGTLLKIDKINKENFKIQIYDKNEEKIVSLLCILKTEFLDSICIII